MLGKPLQATPPSIAPLLGALILVCGACGDGDDILEPQAAEFSEPGRIEPSSPSTASLQPRAGGATAPISPSSFALQPQAPGQSPLDDFSCTAICRFIRNAVFSQIEDFGNAVPYLDCSAAAVSQATACEDCIEALVDGMLRAAGLSPAVLRESELDETLVAVCRRAG